MCGIVYVKNLKNNTPINYAIECLFQAQSSRGKNGFGFVGLTKNEIDLQHFTDEKSCFNYLSKSKFDEVLFHHRFPTSTANRLNSCHPFRIEIDGKKYYFIHNGVVYNSKELREEHLRLDKKYISDNGIDFNDSEALAFDFIRYETKRQKNLKANGSITFVCLKTDSKNKAETLYFYSDGYNDLKMIKNDRIFSLTSEGDGENIKENKLYSFDYKTRKIKMRGLTTSNDYIVFTDWKNCRYTDWQKPSQNQKSMGFDSDVVYYGDAKYRYWQDDVLLETLDDVEQELEFQKTIDENSQEVSNLRKEIRELENEAMFRGLI